MILKGNKQKHITMKTTRFYTLFALLMMAAMGFSQNENLPTETETHIFWQPDRKLCPEDFQCDPREIPSGALQECDSMDYCVVGAFGLFKIVDVTKGRYKPGRYHEKAYMAPAFQKTKSWMLKPDTLGIEIQQLLFDMNELHARSIRYKLDHFLDSTDMKNTDNPYTMFFYTFYEQDTEFFNKLQYKFFHDVVYKEGDWNLERWREFIDTGLEQFKEYATTPEDCYRFVIDKPIEKKMVPAKYVMPSMAR